MEDSDLGKGKNIGMVYEPTELYLTNIPVNSVRRTSQQAIPKAHRLNFNKNDIRRPETNLMNMALLTGQTTHKIDSQNTN